MKWKFESGVRPLKADAPKAGWWQFRQNNSGGSFDVAGGYSTWVWAPSASEANRTAKEHGIYFDGCDSGRDCSCCGDRWSAQGRRGDVEPDEPDMPVAALVASLVKVPERDPRWPSLARSDLQYAAGWGLGIRIIDKDGAVHWLRKDKS